MKIRHHHHNHKPLSQLLPDESAQSAKTIRRVVKIGCAINAFLMTLKICVGYFGHSDALVADGFHSLGDVAADVIMLIFIGISYKAADDRYTFGYGKFETFVSFITSAFLTGIAAMVGIEAIEKIADFFKGAELAQPNIYTFIVVIFAMACKEGLYRFYSHTARKVGSTALLANAWHHRIDAFASIATLIGVTFAHFFGPSLRVLDPIASLVLAVLILIPALRMLVPAFGELMERSLPREDVEKARQVVEETAGVKAISHMRSRRNGHCPVFDIGIRLASGTSIDEASAIASQIETGLQKAFCPHVLVSITTTPDKQ